MICSARIFVNPILQYETNITQLICETDCLTKTDNKLRYTILREMTCYSHVLNQERWNKDFCIKWVLFYRNKKNPPRFMIHNDSNLDQEYFTGVLTNISAL